LSIEVYGVFPLAMIKQFLLEDTRQVTGDRRRTIGGDILGNLTGTERDLELDAAQKGGGDGASQIHLGYIGDLDTISDLLELPTRADQVTTHTA
jgi:hypothetical protein